MSRIIRPYDILLDAARPGDWPVLERQRLVFNKGRLSLAPLGAGWADLADELGVFGGHTLPRGVAIWRDQIFVADPPRNRVLRWLPCCGAAQPLPDVGSNSDSLNGRDSCVADLESAKPAVGPRDLDAPCGLAISARDDLVVVDSGNCRLLLFTLPGLALRRIIGPFNSSVNDAQVWQPMDAAQGPGGWLYVADARGLIWKIDSL